MSNGFSFKNYALISTLSIVIITIYGSLKYEDYYSVINYLCTQKIPQGIFYNFYFACILLLLKIILFIFIGRLRDVEVEQLLENGRTFLLDTVLFIVLSSPTIKGEGVPTFLLATFTLILVTLKTFHLLVQIRVTHIFEVGIPTVEALFKLCILMLLLLLTDFCAIPIFYKGSSKTSTFYLWLFFESLGMLLTCCISILKYAVHLIDSRMGNGWSSKAVLILYLNLINDVLSLVIFLVFVSIYFFNNPSRLPMFVTIDIIQVFRKLLNRLQSFARYRKLTKNLDNFPNATHKEMDEADTCIICRDDLYEGSKKLPCSHIFHVECLKSWFVQQQICPTCRTPITVDEPKQHIVDIDINFMDNSIEENISDLNQNNNTHTQNINSSPDLKHIEGENLTFPSGVDIVETSNDDSPSADISNLHTDFTNAFNNALSPKSKLTGDAHYSIEHATLMYETYGKYANACSDEAKNLRKELEQFLPNSDNYYNQNKS